jgi:hypothetical protein
MAEQVGNPPKGKGVDVFTALNGYDKQYGLPRGTGFSFDPSLTKQFLTGASALKQSSPDLGFIMPTREEAWQQWGNDPLYAGDQNKFNASYDQASTVRNALQTQMSAIEDSLALRYPIQEQAQQIGLSKKVDTWRLGEQDEFQFGQTRPAGTYDTPERMLAAKGAYTDPFGAEKPLYKENLDGFDNGTVLFTDFATDSYGRVIGKPKMRRSMYGDLPVQEQILSSWNLQSRSDGALTALANQVGSAIVNAPGDFMALSQQLKTKLIDGLYGPDAEELGSRGLASTYDQILNGRMPSMWDPEFDGVGGYRDLMRELDGGGYDLVREVEASPDWFAAQARNGDKRAQRGIELQTMLAGTDDGGMSILDKLSGMYAAKSMTGSYKPSQLAQGDTWSTESIFGTVGNAFGQLVPAITISALTAGTLTMPALAGTAAKISAKQGLKWAGARKAAELFLKGSRSSLASAASGATGRTLSASGQNLARFGSMGYTSAFLAGQGYKSALQAGYSPDDAANFGLALLPLMFASEGIGSNYLINRFMSKGADDVLANMAKELAVDAPAKGAVASKEFLQNKAFKIASGILNKGTGAYKTVSEKLSQSAFGNAAFGAMAEGSQEVTEEILNYWAEQWFDKNIGTEAGGIGRFGPEFNMGDRLGLAFLAGGVVGGITGGVLGGRRGTGLDQTIGQLVSTGREKEVLSAADELLKAGSIDQDLHNMIVQEVGLVKDYNNRMDVSDPWMVDMLGSTHQGLTSEFGRYNKLSRDNQEALMNLRNSLADPSITPHKKTEVESEIRKIEELEQVVQERIAGFTSGHRVVQKLIEAEAIRSELFPATEDRESMPSTVDAALGIHSQVKQVAEQLAVSVQDQALKIQELTGASAPEMLQHSEKVFKDGAKLGEALGDAVISGNAESVDTAASEVRKYLGGLRSHGIRVRDFDQKTIEAARAKVQEGLDEVYAQIDVMDEQVGSDEWRAAGKKRTTGYKLADKEAWLGKNADGVIAEMEKLKYGLKALDELEAGLSAAHDDMLGLDDLSDPNALMDRAVNMYLNNVDGGRTLADVEADLKELINSGEDMTAAAAEVNALIEPLRAIGTKRDAIQMLTKVLPGLVDRVDASYSSKVADSGLLMKDGAVLGNDLKNYHKQLRSLSSDPAQQGLARADQAGSVQRMIDSIGRISDLIQTVNSAGPRREEFLRGIQKARLEHRHELLISYGGPDLGGLTAEELDAFTNDVKELDHNDPDDLVKYERALERTEQKLHLQVTKSGVAKFYKAVNQRIIKDLYNGRVNQGYFRASISSTTIDPTSYTRSLSKNAKYKEDALPVATVAWSARIAYGPARAREVFIQATRDTRSGNSTPNSEQEAALVDAHSMAHAPDRELLINALYEPGKFDKAIEGRLVTIFGSAGTGKTLIVPFLIRMASVHRGGKPRILVVVPGKNNRDKAKILGSKYDLGKYAEIEYKGLEAFDQSNMTAGYDLVVVDESHALNSDQVNKLYEGTSAGQVSYTMGDLYQSAFVDQNQSVPAIYDKSMRTLPLSVTYRQNNNPYMLFLSWARGLVMNSRLKGSPNVPEMRGFSAEYSVKNLEGVRTVEDRAQLVELFIESFKPEALGDHVMIVASIADANEMKALLKKDPRLAQYDPAKLVYHMQDGDGSALGAQFRSIFVHIPNSAKNYERLLYTAASRGTDYAVISNVPGVVSKEVDTVQRTEVDQNAINRERERFASRQTILGEELNIEPAKGKKSTASSRKSKSLGNNVPKDDLAKWRTTDGPEVFDMDAEDTATNPVPVVNANMDGTFAKGNLNLWVYGNLLNDGKMALMSGAQVDGKSFGSNPEEALYRAALVDAITSGILGESPIVAMYKEEVNSAPGYEYRLVLEEDSVRELKKIAKRLKYTGDERSLLFVGRILANRDVVADAAWNNVLDRYISSVHEVGASVQNGTEMPGSRTTISFSRPGAPILTDIPKGQQQRPTNSLSAMMYALSSDGKEVSGPFMGRNAKGDPVPYLLARHKGLPESLNTQVWGRMPNVDKAFFDRAIEELTKQKPKKGDRRENMENTLAYHYIRFNRSMLVDRDRNDKETGVRSIINKFFKLSPSTGSKGPVFKHAKDENGVTDAVDAKKALLETMRNLKRGLSEDNGIVKGTFIPFRIIRQGGKRIIDPQDASRLEFPIQRVHFPMGIVNDKFTNESNDVAPQGPDDIEGITGFFTMSSLTDSEVGEARTFVPASQQVELARRIYGDRFVDGVLDFKPRERTNLYGLMHNDRINVYFDTDGNIREGVIDHEAMHWIMNNVLSPETYADILEQARWRAADQDGVQRSWLISDTRANEWLAEEYRKNLPPTNFLSRVLSFVRKVLMRLGLYKPDIDALFQMAASGTLTRSGEPINEAPNMQEELAMAGVLEDVDGGDASLNENGKQGETNEQVVGRGTAASASAVLLQHFPEGILPVARNMFTNALLDRSEYAPVKNALSFIKAPISIKQDSIQGLRKVVSQQRLKLVGQYRDARFKLQDDTEITFLQIGKDNLYEVVDAVRQGRYTNNSDIAPNQLLNDYVISVIGTDFAMGTSNAPDYAVFAAMVKASIGGVRYQGAESSDFMQAEKSFRQGDASSDSINPFGEQSALMKTILIDRPLLYPQPDSQPARQQKLISDSISPKMVDGKVMMQVMSGAMARIRQREATAANDPFNLVSSKLEELLPMLSAELNTVYQRDKRGSYGLHAFTAMQVLTAHDPYLLQDNKTLVYSYGRAYRSLLNKQQVGQELTPAESVNGCCSLGQTLSNVMSPFRSVASVNASAS